jgi:hypothetical protein
MSAEKGDLNWTEILRQAGGPQNLSPIATAQVFLLSAMLREETMTADTCPGFPGKTLTPLPATHGQAKKKQTKSHNDQNT